jgi:DNA-binding NarL/FixJ family response regulator
MEYQWGSPYGSTHGNLFGSSEETKRVTPLSVRDHVVLLHTASGLTAKQVARLLLMSVKTVESHKSNLMRKLDIHDRVELTRFAIREGIIEP